jgi:hypothetical protein
VITERKSQEIAKTISYYNHARIHTAIKMPPAVFAQRQERLVENYYEKRGILLPIKTWAIGTE